MDIDDGQLQKANENIEFAELGNRMHLLKASSMGRKPAQNDQWNNIKCMSLNLLLFFGIKHIFISGKTSARSVCG